ncbi:MAG: hypothetical protein RLZZ361_1385 [Cyanobacteriota bacterium]
MHSKFLKIGLIVFLVSFLSPSIAESTNNSPINLNTHSRPPQNQINTINKPTNIPMDPKSVENFAASPFKLKSAVGQVPVKTRLRIKVDTPISAETAEVGDEFRAKVLNDFYISGDFRKLIVPKDSWIRGRVSTVKKPRLLSRAGKLGIKLDTLVTPLGDYVPLDADLSFMAGVVNQEGLLDPQTDFNDKAIVPTQALLGTDTGKIVSVATLGVPVVGTLLGGTVVALFSHGDDASVTKGQELQIIITRNTDLSI